MTYIVTVNRISYAQKDIEVEANSDNEARSKAIQTAGNLVFREHDAEYEIEGITPRTVN